jgi:ABC-type multidrug transport system ATPase subunit
MNQRRSVLETRALGREYGDLVALEPLDIEIPPGEMVALIGPNGAGKSTLMTLVAGLLEPSYGSAEVDGAEAGSIEARAATSYVPDTPVLYDDLSLDEHLEYIAGMHGLEDYSAKASDLLGRLGLAERGGGLPSQFSHGMRQKTSIAIGLIRPFSLLIADEPFDGLDPPSRTALFDLLREARQGGAAVIVSTHRGDVVDFSDRCLRLEEGSLTYDGPPGGTATA